MRTLRLAAMCIVALSVVVLATSCGSDDGTETLVVLSHDSFDVDRAQTDAESARAQIPPLETIAAVSRHRIAVLTGDQAFNAARIEPWRGDVVVPEAQPGQPATLLQRRPDVLALMAQLDGANARRQANPLGP